MRRVYLLCIEELKKPQYYDMLLPQVCAQRREKVLRCANREDRVRSLGAGLLLQYGIAVWNGQPPREGEPDDPAQCFWQTVALDRIREEIPFEQEMSFRYGPDGKPYLDRIPLFFSLSHSGDYVACALSDREIGVDIQQRRDCSVERLAKRFFAQEEWQWICECPGEEDRLALFCHFWTQKESFGKLTGEGLRSGLAVGPEEKMRGRGAWFAAYDALPGYSVCACWYRGEHDFSVDGIGKEK